MIAATSSRNAAETRGSDELADVLKLRELASTTEAAKAIPTVSATTTVEWPSEKKKPTPTGRFLSCMSFRVTLSIAEI